MEIRHHWPEETEVRKQPSRFSKIVTGRLICASLMLLIVGCIVLFMALFHDVLPENGLACIFLCTTFTGAVLFVLNLLRKGIVTFMRKRGVDLSPNQGNWEPQIVSRGMCRR